MVKNETSPNPKNRIWMFFASVKLKVAVLLTLAVTSIIGTVIPQNESSAAYIDAYGENLYRIFSFLNFFDDKCCGLFLGAIAENLENRFRESASL